MKITIFAEYINPAILENDTNEWLTNNQIDVKEIKYSTCADGNAIYHSVMIFYKKESE